MKTTKIVTYYRVSTNKQGLGIEAQKSAVKEYLKQHPELIEIGSFTETYTGKEANRPEFSKAIELCRRSGAMLVAAKLDRLGRGKFLYTLLGDTSVTFKALDIAGNSELERGLRVMVAIEERNSISHRTSAALRAKANILAEAGQAYASGNIDEAQRLIDLAEIKSRAKRGLQWWVERDFKLGSKHKNSDAEKNAKANARRKEADSDKANVEASAAIRVFLRDGGKRTYGAIAKHLNENNYRTRRGKGGWSSQAVKNLMLRFGI